MNIEKLYQRKVRTTAKIALLTSFFFTAIFINTPDVYAQPCTLECPIDHTCDWNASGDMYCKPDFLGDPGCQDYECQEGYICVKAGYTWICRESQIVDDSINLGEGFNMGVLVENFFKIAFPLAIILGFINIVTAGYTLMTSEGDPRKTNEGKERLESAIMGLLFVLLTIGILRIILGTLISGEPPGF